MKKMKKILAFVLAMAMVLGMSVTALATGTGDGTGDGDGAGGNGGSTGTTQSTTSVDITGKPTSENKAPVIIQNVEAGATVTAYRIVVPIYDPDSAVGFKGYESLKVVQSEGADPTAIVADPLKPTAEEVMNIATTDILQKITGENKVGMNDAVAPAGPNGFVQGTVKTTGEANEKGKADYTAQLGAGYWLVLVTGTKEDVYNPMLVGVYYSAKNGTQNTLEGAELDSNSQFTINGSEVYAKSTKPSIDKKIVDNAGNELKKFDVADTKTVYFQIDTVIPSYSEEYTKATVSIKDELSAGLGLNQDSIVVKVNGSVLEPTAGNTKTYTITNKSATGFEITFDQDYILSTEGRKNFRNVVVTYNAILDAKKAGINFDPNTNKATLTYTNKPDVDGTTTTKEDTTYSYTFGIDVKPYGSSTESWNVITRELLKGEVVTETENGHTTTKFVPLGGATFTLTNKNDSTQVYTSTSKTVAENASDDEKKTAGLLSFTGLAEGTYTLKETKAPDGYSLNTKEYEVVISAKYDDKGRLEEYTITIDGVGTTYKATYDQTDVKKVTNIDTTSTKKDDNGKDVIVTTEIPNTKLNNLPSTGGIGTTIFTIGGCAIMIIAAGLFFASRRKSSK